MAGARGRSPGRARLVALAVALLVGLGVLAPAALHAADGHRNKAHPVAAVTARILDNQSAASHRSDQPALVSTVAHTGGASRGATVSADSSATANSSTVDSARTRGPPQQAR